MQRSFSQYQAKYFAHFLTREGFEDGDALTQSLSSARVDLNPHQVDAAMFALRSPLSKGVLLADEVGLGKTIEAALVALKPAQFDRLVAAGQAIRRNRPALQRLRRSRRRRRAPRWTRSRPRPA